MTWRDPLAYAMPLKAQCMVRIGRVCCRCWRMAEPATRTGSWCASRFPRASPSIERHVVVQQTHKAAVVFVRQDRGGLSEIVSGDDAILDLPEIDISTPPHEACANPGL